MEYNLTDFYLFKNCQKKLLDEIAENINIWHAISGEIIFNQGDIPKNLYIVLDGSLYVTEFTEDGKAVAHDLISKGDCFGEIAIIDQKLRSASILCAENVKLGVLSSNFVQNILLKSFESQHKFISKMFSPLASFARLCAIQYEPPAMNESAHANTTVNKKAVRPPHDLMISIGEHIKPPSWIFFTLFFSCFDICFTK